MMIEEGKENPKPSSTNKFIRKITKSYKRLKKTKKIKKYPKVTNKATIKKLKSDTLLALVTSMFPTFLSLLKVLERQDQCQLCLVIVSQVPPP